MDTLVLDIETKQTFAEVGGKGREFLSKLEMSVACIYSYAKNSYTCFDETQLAELKAFLSDRALLVGFSSNKFDLPILSRTLGLDLLSYPRFDISDEIEQRAGRLIGLGKLAAANLGITKLGEAVGAPVLYRAGKIKELKEYCQQDVKLTKELFDRIKKQGSLLIPERDSDAPTVLELHIDPQLLF